MSKTIDEIRILRTKLESDIIKLISDFEKESGVKVETFDTTHIDSVSGIGKEIVGAKVKIAY